MVDTALSVSREPAIQSWTARDMYSYHNLNYTAVRMTGSGECFGLLNGLSDVPTELLLLHIQMVQQCKHVLSNCLELVSLHLLRLRRGTEAFYVRDDDLETTGR